MNLDKEILVGTGKILYSATSDTFRRKMGIELILKDEDPELYYKLIGVLKTKPICFFESDHGKNIIIYDYKDKKILKKIPLTNEIY